MHQVLGDILVLREKELSCPALDVWEDRWEVNLVSLSKECMWQPSEPSISDQVVLETGWLKYYDEWMPSWQRIIQVAQLLSAFNSLCRADIRRSSKLTSLLCTTHLEVKTMSSNKVF